MVRSSIFWPVGCRLPLRQQAQKPLRAPRQVLMHVGVPTGGQRQPHVVRQARAQHPQFAGAGDVNQVRLEALQHLADQRNVAQKRRIVAQVFFQSKGEKAARQLQRPHVAVFSDGLRSRSPARTHRKGRFRRRAKASKWRLVCATPFTSWNESGKYATRGMQSVQSLDSKIPVCNASAEARVLVARIWKRSSHGLDLLPRTCPARLPSYSPRARRNWRASLHAMRRPPETRPMPIICTMPSITLIALGGFPSGHSSLSGRTTPFASG